jgi:hypothetical protein
MLSLATQSWFNVSHHGKDDDFQGSLYLSLDTHDQLHIVLRQVQGNTEPVVLNGVLVREERNDRNYLRVARQFVAKVKGKNVIDFSELEDVVFVQEFMNAMKSITMRSFHE